MWGFIKSDHAKRLEPRMGYAEAVPMHKTLAHLQCMLWLCLALLGATQFITDGQTEHMQLGIFMEGPITADAANDLATRLLAGGLRPSSQVPDAEPLQFHIAVGHMNAQASIAPAGYEALLKRMLTALKDMNDGSRKAIRLVKL